jgi:hypothetical protein
MSKWVPKPKYMLAEGDTYTKRPDDETYPQLAVNYLKLDRVTLYNESWAPIVEGSAPATSSALQEKFSFTTGASKVPAQRAFTTRPSSTLSPRLRRVGLERRHPRRPSAPSTSPTLRPSARRPSRSPLMPPAKNGFGLPYGIQRAMEPGSSQSR